MKANAAELDRVDIAIEVCPVIRSSGVTIYAAVVTVQQIPTCIEGQGVVVGVGLDAIRTSGDIRPANATVGRLYDSVRVVAVVNDARSVDVGRIGRIDGHDDVIPPLSPQKVRRRRQGCERSGSGRGGRAKHPVSDPLGPLVSKLQEPPPLTDL